MDKSHPSAKKEPALITPAQNKEPGSINTPHLVGTQARPSCSDFWIENYLSYIERLNCQSGSEPLPTRALAIAMRRYGAFCRSCRPMHRRNTWRAVHKAVALLS